MRRYVEAMTVSRVFVTLAALMLLVMSEAALVATGIAWVPCDAGLYSEGCLRAMDQPANGDVSSTAWLGGSFLCVTAVVLSIHSSSTLSPRLTVGALIAVVVGNPYVDYSVSLAFSPNQDLWDSPPGMGYPSAVALGIGAVLLLWAAASARARVTEPAAVAHARKEVEAR
jgi:hypothetical protein